MSMIPLTNILGVKSVHEELAEYCAAICAEYFNDPLGWATMMYPWGTPGTPLEGLFLRDWQASILAEIGHAIAAGENKIQVDVASGHGIGKSSLIAILNQWLITTRHTRGIITANTKTQLETKTMPEFMKWANLCLAKDWMDITATSVKRRVPNAEDWRIDAIPWVKEKPDAFGGLHNLRGALIITFDEASGIHGVIWETVDGAMSDRAALIIWVRFGNPLRNVGRFADTFRKAPPAGVYTIRRNIDSREVEGTDVEFINARIEENGGEDGDYARSRWRGVFPSQSDWQLISTEAIDQAMRSEPAATSLLDPILMGIDYSRGGGDKTVVRLRRGRDAKSFRSYRWGSSVARDSMQLASMISEIIRIEKPHHIFADSGGIGGPINDRLRDLGHKVTDVIAAGASDDPARWLNRRAQMWCRMGDWLKAGGTLDPHPTLRQDLIQQEFQYRADSTTIVLVSKEDMRKDGLPSPDEAEALAQTFAFEVAPLHDPREAAGLRTSQQELDDWDPLA